MYATTFLNDQSDFQNLMHVLEQKGMSSTVYDYSTLIEDLKKQLSLLSDCIFTKVTPKTHNTLVKVVLKISTT